jgi:O-antigen ligase
MAAGAQIHRWEWAAGVGVTAAAIGLLAVENPELALLFAFALAFVPLVMADLTIGVCLFTLISFVDIIPTVGGSNLTFTKVAGLLLALSWLATLTTRGGPGNSFFADHPMASYALGLFLSWIALSVLWADRSHAVADTLLRLLPNLLLLPILYTGVRKREHAVWVVVAFVTGAVLSAAYGLVVTPSAALQDVGLAGVGVDPNELAAILVAGAVLALGLAGIARTPLKRLTAVEAAALCLGTMLLTLSRGGLVALAVVLVASLFFAGPRWRRVAVALVVVATSCVVLYFGSIASSGQRKAVTTIGSGTGRVDVWTVGWRMFTANPIHGVGAGNFSSSSVHYLLQPGAITRSDFIVERPRVALNMYLHVVAELGVVGLALFGSILLFCLGSAVKATRRFVRADDIEMELLSRVVVMAIVSILAADFFLSGQFSKQLWILLALGPCLLKISSTREPASTA